MIGAYDYRDADYWAGVLGELWPNEAICPVCGCVFTEGYNCPEHGISMTQEDLVGSPSRISDAAKAAFDEAAMLGDPELYPPLLRQALDVGKR